jgi:hypothetical protein
MWLFLYGPQGFADLSRFDSGTGPRLGAKAGVEVRFCSGESTGKGRNLDGSTLTPLLTNSGLISNVIGAIVGK